VSNLQLLGDQLGHGYSIVTVSKNPIFTHLLADNGDAKGTRRVGQKFLESCYFLLGYGS